LTRKAIFGSLLERPGESMDNQNAENARLIAIVTVRREHGKLPFIRVETEPDASQACVARSMEVAVPKDLLARLPAGQYTIARTMRSGSRIVSAPKDCPSGLIDAIINALLEPMDVALHQLRDALLAVPDDEACARIVGDLYGTLFGCMVEDDTAMEIRPGFSSVIVTSQPSGLDNPARVADDKKVRAWRTVLSAFPYPVVFIHDGRSVRAFLGIVRDDLPFSKLLLKRIRAGILRVHDDQLNAKAREAFVTLTESVDRFRTYADRIGHAFDFDHGTAVIEGVGTVVYQGGGYGDA